MKYKLFTHVLALLVVFVGVGCTPEPSTNNTTDPIVGTYRKDSISWNGSLGYCEVNQIINIAKNAEYQATLIGSYEVITQPSGGLGAPYIAYVGSYNLTGCSLFESGGIITISYTNDAVPDGDLAQISDLAGTLSGNNLVLSVTRGQNSSSTATFIKQ